MIELQDLLGGCRILFGSFFLVKLGFSWDAREFFWSVRKPPSLIFNLCFWTLISSCVLFTFGLFTPFSAFVMWLSYVYLYRYVALFSLEDIVFQFVSFYFVFAGAGAAFSLDHLFFSSALSGRLGGYEYFLPELALISAGGFNFFSAGIEKMKSPMWRSGTACFYFFQLPNVRRIALPFLINRKWIMWSFNHVTTVVEFAFLPLLFINYRPFGFILWILCLGFVASLVIFFVLNWIGEVELLFLAITAWVVLFSPANSMLEDITRINWLEFSNFEIASVVFLSLTIFTCLWTTAVPRNYFQNERWNTLRKIDFFFRKACRLSWGLLPVTAFTEMHVQGVAVYQVLAGDDPQKPIAWPIFNEKFQPGRARNFRPTGFEAQSYKFTEACMELDLYGEVRTPERKAFFEKTCELAWRKSKNYLGRYPDSLIFRVCQFNPPPPFTGYSTWYLNDWVKEALKVYFENGKFQRVEILHRPILREKPMRDLNRNSFLFKT